MAEMMVEAQCQRCGRGFIAPYRGDGRDHYGYPRRKRDGSYEECRGSVLPLEKAVPMERFENYGPRLPTASPHG